MSLARKVIESRRRKVVGVKREHADLPNTRTLQGEGGLPPTSDVEAPQKWKTHGHRVSEKATSMAASVMEDKMGYELYKDPNDRRDRRDKRARDDRGDEDRSRRRRKIIHGGRHGNSYEPIEVKGGR